MSTIKLSKAALEKRRAYQKEWRKNNRDKVKQHQAAYWERLADREVQEEKQQEA